MLRSTLRNSALLLFVPTLVLSQRPQPGGAIPDDIQFVSFFMSLSLGESVARSAGQRDSAIKQTLKDKAGLTDAQFSLLHETALSCIDAYNEKTRAGFNELREFAPPANPGDPPPLAVVATINALERERAKVITDCMDRLKRGMGEEPFAKLQTYVRSTKGQSMRRIDPPRIIPNAESARPPELTPLPGVDSRTGGVK
jgi:hypothetical protein